MIKNKVDFNNYSNNYNEVMKKQHSKFGDISYYSKHKVDTLKEIIDSSKKLNILEFGCGIGNNIPHLISSFKNSEIYGYDISENSLDIAKSNNDKLNIILEDELKNYNNFFDLIFIAGVYHHIPIKERNNVTKRLFNLLNKNGKVIVFEHNPYNPLTRHMVNTCEFDEDAILLYKNELEKLFFENSFLLEYSAYTLFIPPKLKAFNFIEKYIQWLPLGGQYYIVMKKDV